jgi:hypothetical protein
MTRYIGVVAWVISAATIALIMTTYWVVDRRLDRLEGPVYPPDSKVVTVVGK